MLFVSVLLLGSAAAFAPVAVTRSSISTSSLGLAVGNDAHEEDQPSRRAFFAQSIASAAALSLPSIASAADSTENFDDADYGFRIRVPSNWESSTQQLSGRRKAVFFTDPSSKDAESGNIETLAFVAYTPLRDDFTSLGSFGSVDQVAQATILPQGDLAGGNSDASRMLSATSKNNAYYFDYVTTPMVPTEPGSGGVLTKTLKPLHFRTIFTLLPFKGSSGLTLVTITLQTTEGRYGAMKGVFDGVVDSFGKITG